MKLLTNCKPFFASISSGIVAICMATPAMALPTYSVLDLGTLGDAGSQALAINSSGQVVGWSYSYGSQTHSGRSYATLFNASGNINLGTLGGEGYAFDINDSGQIVGSLYDAGGFAHATLFGASGNVDLGTPFGGDVSVAIAINNSGQIVGRSQTAYLPGNQYSWLLSASGNIDLGTLGGDYSQPNAINDSGQIVGYARLANGLIHATLFSASGNVDLGTLLGGLASMAYDINENGQIVGWSYSAGGGSPHATLFSASGNIDLGIFGDFTSANAINNSGQIVGQAMVNGNWDGLIWDGGVMRTLDSLIDPASGWDVSFANDINDMGQIAATGRDGNGNEHALLLTPISRNSVPEPATGLLIGTALFGFFATRIGFSRACHNSGRPTLFGEISTPLAVEPIRHSTSPSRRIVT